MRWRRIAITALPVVTFLIAFVASLSAQYPPPLGTATDPGVRGGDPGAGAAIAGLTPGQGQFFDAGKADFEQAEGVADGLGPRFNLNSCGGCHAQPAIGGTSPAINPQIAMATDSGGQNQIPFFVLPNGPTREARFKYQADGVTRDGGVHDLFVITGRSDAPSGCQIAQEDFNAQAARNNLIFRIPTPTFGLGLVEAIPDNVISQGLGQNYAAKQAMGIYGRVSRVPIGMNSTVNRNGNDGTIARFGWKAQNKSLLLFSGEAYNVEMGISNELFQTERDETAACQAAFVANNVANLDAAAPIDATSDIEKFSDFMRFLAPPTPSQTVPGGALSITSGSMLFGNIGCAHCHTPTLMTGNSPIAALRNQPVNLFSDLSLHKMGPGLADDIIQGQAAPDEFRTAPLWGLGQRLFFLHDGRTSDLLVAIRAHRSAASSQFGASEANQVINLFDALLPAQQQDILNFLRSL
ncbi:MAG TPA: di-heme oxidoredictase family protein [Vicinamibacterales bacterium]|nr:di-heme oxidoredictase family protein [Vicinamibacterales bacterium]